MPRNRWTRVFEDLKSNEKLKHIPVIVYFYSLFEASEKDFYNFGASGAWLKAMDLKLLPDQKFLRQSAGSLESIAAVGSPINTGSLPAYCLLRLVLTITALPHCKPATWSLQYCKLPTKPPVSIADLGHGKLPKPDWYLYYRFLQFFCLGSKSARDIQSLLLRAYLWMLGPITDSLAIVEISVRGAGSRCLS